MRWKIKNREELLSYGCRQSRRVVLDITDSVLKELDAYGRIRSILKCEGNLLKIGERCWDLSKKRHVYLIGAGKACNAMAMAVEDAIRRAICPPFMREICRRTALISKMAA